MFENEPPGGVAFTPSGCKVENLATGPFWWRVLSWPKEVVVEFLGRNGSAKCVGVSLMQSVNSASGVPCISLAPMSTRGEEGRCRIEIPTAAAADLARQLLDVAGLDDPTATNSCPSDKAPSRHRRIDLA